MSETTPEYRLIGIGKHISQGPVVQLTEDFTTKDGKKVFQKESFGRRLETKGAVSIIQFGRYEPSYKIPNSIIRDRPDILPMG